MESAPRTLSVMTDSDLIPVHLTATQAAMAGRGLELVAKEMVHDAADPDDLDLAVIHEALGAQYAIESQLDRWELRRR